MLSLTATVVLILLMAVVIWKQVAIQEASTQLRRSVEQLQIALRDEAMADEDVIVTLREAKHFTEGWRHLVERLLDELYETADLPPIKWEDREEARRKFLEHHRRHHEP